MEGLPVRSRSAEDYGTLLTAELERAMVLGDSVLGVCVDQTKAYDSVRLDLLEFLLEGSGMPNSVWQPMADMARAPRRLEVMTAVGDWREPPCGFIPGCPAAAFVVGLLFERWRRGVRSCSPQAAIRCWVVDSTASARGKAPGLAVWAAATRGFEDIEQGDGGRVNRVKSGVLVSDSELEKLVLQASAVRAACPFGLVIGTGFVEPAGWQELWRGLLDSPPAMVFRWRSSRAGAEELAAAAAAEADTAAAAAEVAAEAAGAEAKAAAEVAAVAIAAAESTALPSTVAAIRSLQVQDGLGDVAKAAAALAVQEAAEKAETAAGVAGQARAAREAATEAAAAALEPMAVAAATTVWIDFDGIPPAEDVQTVLAGNRGVWLPAAAMLEERLQQARIRVLADGAEDRWARSPQLQLPVLKALKDLGVAQGLGMHAKDLQASRTRTAFTRLRWVARLGLPRPALCRVVGGSALLAGMYGAASHVYDSDTLPTLRRWVMHALYRGSRFADVRLFMQLVLPSLRGDPWHVALTKGWHAAELIRQEWGEADFWRIWQGPSRDGPLASFKGLLKQVGLAASFEASAGAAVGAWRGGGRGRPHAHQGAAEDGPGVGQQAPQQVERS
jgi:hypothetical protein